MCFEVLTEKRTILTLALTPSLALEAKSLALALKAKSLALALRVVALTPSLHNVEMEAVTQKSGDVALYLVSCDCMTQLNCHIWKSSISGSTKVHVYKVYVMPILLYCCGTWTVTK